MVERKILNKNFQNFDSLELETAPPNILFFISDDQSWKHYSAYGDKAVKSPAFDQIAREGVLFNNAYTVCPSCALPIQRYINRTAYLASGRRWHLWMYLTPQI